MSRHAHSAHLHFIHAQSLAIHFTRHPPLPTLSLVLLSPRTILAFPCCADEPPGPTLALGILHLTLTHYSFVITTVSYPYATQLPLTPLPFVFRTIMPGGRARPMFLSFRTSPCFDVLVWYIIRDSLYLIIRRTPLSAKSSWPVRAVCDNYRNACGKRRGGYRFRLATTRVGGFNAAPQPGNYQLFCIQ
ncbi:hypothetical protein PENSPDRAFT_262884 [Peniophora sp. CONT]|nr:hypothetical protein PENSPDRAFT_262884 [Peniophora sp. CONT]